MVLYFDEATLVQEDKELRPGDPIIFIRNFQGQDILTTDDTLSSVAGLPVRFGRGYYATHRRFCIVPDVWNSLDALRAKEYVTCDQR